MEGPLWKYYFSLLSNNKHGRHGQFLFLIGRFQNNFFSLKLLGQMKSNLTGSMYGRSFMEILFLAPIEQQTWPP